MADVRCQETQGGQEKTTVATRNMDGSDSESDTEDIYEVEKIVDMTKSKGKTLYRVRWAGYGPTWDTWEPYDNLESCHHVIDQYMEDRRIAQEEERAAKVEQDGKEASLGDSDSDSVQSGASRASRKRKSSKANYVYVEDEDCDTLKDKFWRDLEEGKINVFGNDMYSKVKGQGRSARPASFSDMFKNQPLEQQEGNEEETSEQQEERHTHKRLRRENSASESSSISEKMGDDAEITPNDDGSIPEVRCTKKARRSSLANQLSMDSESSVFMPDSPATTTTTTISTGSKRRARQTSKSKASTVVVAEPKETSGGGDAMVEGIGGERRKGSDCGSFSGGEAAGSCSSRSELRVKSDSRVNEECAMEREESPVRERAPIMVIRRSADGNGYTQKLVEGRPRAKLLQSSLSDERSITSKSTEKKLSPPSSRELTTIKTVVTSPVSIKITTVPRRPFPDIAMDTSSSKLRSSPRIAPTHVASPVASRCVSVEKFKLGHQMAGLSLEDIREEWAKRDAKLAACHVPLFDVTVKKLKEAGLCHRQGNERNNNLNNNVKGENGGPVYTVMAATSSGGPPAKKTSPPRAFSTTKASTSGMNTSTTGELQEQPRIPKMKISTSPPTCRCVTSTSSMSASLSSLTTYRIHSSLTATKNTCIKSEASTPTSNTNSSTNSRTSLTQPSIPPPTITTKSTTIPPVGDSTTTPPIPKLKYETMESFISGLGQQGEEEIPGLGDILPLSLRPTLEPGAPITTRTPPNQTTVNPPRGQPLGNTLPPISTLPGASPPSVQNTTRQMSPLSQSALHSQTSPLAQCGLVSQTLSHTQQYPSHHSSHSDLSGLSSLLGGGGAGGVMGGQPTDNNASLLPNHHHLYADLSVPPSAAPGVIGDTVHRRPPYPVPSPTQYSTSMLSPFSDPSVMSPPPHMEPMSPLSGYIQPSPSHLSMESPRYSGTTLEESCNQFNDVDMRRVGNPNTHTPAHAQQMNRSAGTPGSVPNAAPPRSGYNPYSPHQGTSPYATSTGSPAAWSMSSPSPGTPGGPVNTTQGLGAASSKLLDDTAFDFDLLEVDPSLWDQKHSSDKNAEQVEVTNLELKNAVRNNDYETVRRALSGRTRYDLEMRDEMGITLLMMAAARSHDDVLELLVLNAANINARSKNGSTTLMFACENGHRCTVELLLIMGAHMNVQTATGDTALTKAVKNGNKHIVRLLLDHGANFSSPSYLNDLTAMKVAKQRNQIEITEILKKHLSWVTADFENQVKITLNNTAGILCALFPMQCFALSESDHITITFNHELQPTLPGVGVLLFIAHARITSSEVRCRFYGPCAVNGATLNGYQLHPLTEEANFVMSFSPLYNGRNDLEIKTVKAPTSRAKLVVCAYKAQLVLPPD